ncbi:aspartate aminotransferase family protein [Fructilactobacillus florum]|uniref:4-aminobutyrate aminotransferase n=1 Tax=Fructilactobacillus florum DSM 22689 = JCM 16035 TaxID=1423745 RepID=A0A0R2CP35_9LACO|nr:aspartate aminotransferase family protein [Fructilactobacillus florum]KRM90233.1 4-aminobutyrate aminotransferase [Fructilactobacillus florum DSM 22689 = JCM 16035]
MGTNQSLLNREQQNYAPADRIKYFDIVLASGQGASLTDVEGHEYLDLLSSASATNVGHCHPHVVEAIKRQADQLIQYTPAYFATKPEVALTERLAALAPIDGPVKVAFGNSGSDANDAIIKFARAATGRSYVVSFTGAYHGSTYGSISTSAISLNMSRKIGPLLPNVIKMPFPSPWERLAHETDTEFSERMFQEFLRPFTTYLPPEETAVIEIEPIQGDGGFLKVPEHFMNLIYQFAQDHGILFAVDEVNQGLGRSGKMWSIEHFPHVHPDLVAIGKSLAAGLPLSAVLGRAKVMDALAAPGNVYTTAGNPVTTAAASAVLDVIADEQLVERSARLGARAADFFNQLQTKYPVIHDVRLYGLNGGLEICKPHTDHPDSNTATRLIQRIFELGALMITVRGNVLRFQPPLVITEAELDRALQIIAQAFQELEAGRLTGPVPQLGWN